MIFEKAENKENIDSDTHPENQTLKFLNRKVNRTKANTFKSRNIKNSEFEPENKIPIFKQETAVELILTNTNKIKAVTCNCKNSQCLKLYCDCFSAMGYCDPSVCSCQGCSNTPENEVIYFLIFHI